jgi:ferredoxin
MNACVDLDGCMGCGMFGELCRDVFEVCEAGSARMLVDDCAAWADCIVEAAERCPQDAVIVDEG